MCTNVVYGRFLNIGYGYKGHPYCRRYQESWHMSVDKTDFVL